VLAAGELLQGALVVLHRVQLKNGALSGIGNRVTHSYRLGGVTIIYNLPTTPLTTGVPTPFTTGATTAVTTDVSTPVTTALATTGNAATTATTATVTITGNKTENSFISLLLVRVFAN
jgi:hypothetical protein